jgi:hypothetical protein
MKRGWKILIIILIIFIILNIYIYTHGRKVYRGYYEECLNIGDNQGAFDDAYDCTATQGCYYMCGSSCPPKQVNTFLDIFTRTKACTEQCVPQCVCQLGKRFAGDYGCV